MTYLCNSFVARAIECSLTGLYGHPESSKRETAWHLLHLIKSEVQLHWFYFGDFNEIIKSFEKKGGGSRPFSHMEVFQNSILRCGPHELNTFRVRFTWSNKRSVNTYTKEKLDRALAFKEALFALPSSHCEALPAIKSDHSPPIITLCKEAASLPIKAFTFRYVIA